MSRIPVDLITKSGPKTESYYEYLISRYIAPYFTLLFKKLRIHNPNIITWCAFSLILIASAMVVNLGILSSIVYRVIIAVLIQLNFIWDCSDGQLARITGTTSKLGAWLDKILDRVGEFIIFSVFGYVAWQYTGNLIFLLLGIITGYSLSAFTLAMALSNSSKLQNLAAIEKITSNKKSSKEKRKVKKNINEIRMVNVITKIFFFLNFGIGERYLYLSFFILIFRLDIMLYISSFFAFLRMMSISYHVGKRLRTIDRRIRELNEKAR